MINPYTIIDEFHALLTDELVAVEWDGSELYLIDDRGGCWGAFDYDGDERRALEGLAHNLVGKKPFLFNPGNLPWYKFKLRPETDDGDINYAIAFACDGIASLSIIHEQKWDWKKLCHGIMAMHYKTEWIPVADVLPENGQGVFMYRANEDEVENRYLYGLYAHDEFFGFHYPARGITHWMPLPEGPE